MAAQVEPGFIEPISGRYVHLALGERPCRVYFEEAGRGIPLVCLHTAGSDGRQFRHLMNDSAVTDHFRIVAFDLPWHGKSTPPPGWQDQEYRLTTSAYVAAVMAFIRALNLDRPVVMGCSMGGRIVLELALPLWAYMQSGPGVFKGDLYFYRVDSDFRERVPRIDTDACPVFLLTGDYDFSCTPEDTLRTAAKIKGAEALIMEGLGHFPMCEDPERFRGYILPVLEKVRAARSRM